MYVRLAMPEDEAALIDLTQRDMAESMPDHEFDLATALKTFKSYFETANPTIWVVEDRREVIAFLLAGMYEYRAAKGFFTCQEALFVREDRRGGRAAMLLMQNFIAWSERIGALEIRGGNDNGLFTERTTSFLARFGFVRVGNAMRKVL